MYNHDKKVFDFLKFDLGLDYFVIPRTELESSAHDYIALNSIKCFDDRDEATSYGCDFCDEISKYPASCGYSLYIPFTDEVELALRKMVPLKPRFVDVRFRNHGRRTSDGSSLCKCYECPTCQSHIFRVFDSNTHCEYCGQHLDWGDQV